MEDEKIYSVDAQGQIVHLFDISADGTFAKKLRDLNEKMSIDEARAHKKAKVSEKNVSVVGVGVEVGDSNKGGWPFSTIMAELAQAHGDLAVMKSLEKCIRTNFLKTVFISRGGKTNTYGEDLANDREGAIEQERALIARKRVQLGAAAIALRSAAQGMRDRCRKRRKFHRDLLSLRKNWNVVVRQRSTLPLRPLRSKELLSVKCGFGGSFDICSDGDGSLRIEGEASKRGNVGLSVSFENATSTMRFGNKEGFLSHAQQQLLSSTIFKALCSNVVGDGKFKKAKFENQIIRIPVTHGNELVIREQEMGIGVGQGEGEGDFGTWGWISQVVLWRLQLRALKNKGNALNSYRSDVLKFCAVPFMYRIVYEAIETVRKKCALAVCRIIVMRDSLEVKMEFSGAGYVTFEISSFESVIDMQNFIVQKSVQCCVEMIRKQALMILMRNAKRGDSVQDIYESVSVNGMKVSINELEIEVMFEGGDRFRLIATTAGGQDVVLSKSNNTYIERDVRKFLENNLKK